MKTKKLFIFLFSTILTLSCNNDPGCHKSYEESWSFEGRQMVGFYSVRATRPGASYNFTDTVISSDTMRLFIESKSIHGDSFRNDTLVALRDSSGIELSIYADVYDWQGCGAMPPTALNPQNGFLKLPPPFHPGIFLIKLHQPDTVISLDTLIVQ